MTSHFERGRRLGFDLRLRPVRRLHRDLADPQLGRALTRGAEVDAFRLEVMRRFPSGWADSAAARAGVTRESVYADWLCERLGNAVACRGVQVGRCQSVPGSARQEWRSGGSGRDSARHVSPSTTRRCSQGFCGTASDVTEPMVMACFSCAPPNKPVPEQ